MKKTLFTVLLIITASLSHADRTVCLNEEHSICPPENLQIVAADNRVRYASPTGTESYETAIDTAHPCSLSSVNTNAIAGDHVYLLDGKYTNPIDLKNNGIGNLDSQRIIIESLNKHGAIIAPTASYGSCIYSNDQYNSFIGLHLIAADTYNGAGVVCNSSSVGIKITNCLIDGTGITSTKLAGIIYNGMTPELEHNEIKHFRVGIQLANPVGTAGKVNYNYIHDLDVGDPYESDGIRCIGGGDFSGTVIGHNVITKWAEDCIDLFNGSNIDVISNECYSPLDTALGNGIKLGGGTSTGNAAYSNYVHHLDAGLHRRGIFSNSCTNGIIHGNIVDAATEGIWIYNDDDDWKITNNVVVNATRYAIFVGDNADSVEIQNNITDGDVNDIVIGANISVTGGANIFINDSVPAVNGTSTYAGIDKKISSPIDTNYHPVGDYIGVYNSGAHVGLGLNYFDGTAIDTGNVYIGALPRS